MPPQVDFNRQPVAVVANFFWIKHQRTVSACANDITLQSRFGDDLAIAIGQLLAQLINVHVILARQHASECRQAGGHRNRIGIVSPAVKNLVLRYQIHHGFVRAKSRERQASANRLSQANHVRPNVEVL